MPATVKLNSEPHDERSSQVGIQGIAELALRATAAANDSDAQRVLPGRSARGRHRAHPARAFRRFPVYLSCFGTYGSPDRMTIVSLSWMEMTGTKPSLLQLTLLMGDMDPLRQHPLRGPGHRGSALDSAPAKRGQTLDQWLAVLHVRV